MFKKILILLVLAVGGFLGYAATRPDTFHVERSQAIEAPAPVVFAQLDNFKNWAVWSPWEKLDPDMKKTFEGPDSGIGAIYSWQGNKEVGKGNMKIMDAKPPTEITYRLEFIEPFAAVSETGFVLSPEGENATSLTWRMDGKNDFMAKVFGVFMDTEKMIGADFEKGLAALKTVSEEAAQKQAAEAKAEAEAAAAEAAAKAEAEAKLAQESAAAEAAKGRRGRKKAAR